MMYVARFLIATSRIPELLKDGDEEDDDDEEEDDDDEEEEEKG
jgi:hypothetical protein